MQYAHVLQEGKTKSIVVACLDSFDPQILMIPAIRAYREKYPNIHVRIESDAAQEIRRMLILGEVDLIFSIYYDFRRRNWKRFSGRCWGTTPQLRLYAEKQSSGRACKAEDRGSETVRFYLYLAAVSAGIQRYDTAYVPKLAVLCPILQNMSPPPTP